MADNGASLRWSSQLTVTPPSQTPKLSGDKIILPQSALEQLLAAAPIREVSSNVSHRYTRGFDPFNPHTFDAESLAREQTVGRQQQLPHPLIFRIVNPQNGRMIYAGIREFSAEENEVCLSPFLRDALGVEGSYVESHSEHGISMDADTAETNESVPNPSHSKNAPVVTIHANQLPKGTYVRLRPLAAGYDPEDWKALLERYLRDNFTTLSVREILTVPGGPGESFQFLVDKVYPEGDGICVVDTDLEVDIVALTEDQARETLQRRLEKATRGLGTKEGSSVGGVIGLGELVRGQVLPGQYVDYELREWNYGSAIDIEVQSAGDNGVYLFASPLSSRQRERPRDDVHIFGDFSPQPTKRIRIQPPEADIGPPEALYISVNASAQTGNQGDANQSQLLPVQYELQIVQATSSDHGVETDDKADHHDPEDVLCKNCHQWVPQRTFVLHENFCLRNNVFCSQCGNVFQKRSPEWQNHWHCCHDSSHGNTTPGKQTHDIIFHERYSCPNCQSEENGLPGLAKHRSTVCPGKLILCQFCHLVVPQQGESDPDINDPEVVLSGLTPHEIIDGGRTTECHLCNKITRLRDMNTHLRHHNLERLSRPTPRICLNQNCGRTLDSRGVHNANDSLGLCSICFGPLYVDTYDPEGKALRRRVDRRYLSQMMTGCGKPWCQNAYCKTGRQAENSESNSKSASLSVAEITKLVRPLVDAINVNGNTPNTAPFYFCTDQTGQQRRSLAEMLSAEGAATDGTAYDLAWCIAAVEATGGNMEKASEWLTSFAPTMGETAAHAFG